LYPTYIEKELITLEKKNNTTEAITSYKGDASG